VDQSDSGRGLLELNKRQRNVLGECHETFNNLDQPIVAGRPRTRENRRLGRVCGAKNRKGLPCQCKLLFKSGRCKFHGGMSTGPKSAEGKAKIMRNLMLTPSWKKKMAEKAENESLLTNVPLAGS
jgi:hypothetical protein